MQRLLATVLADAILAAPLPPEVRRAYRLLLLISGVLVGVFAMTILLVRILRQYRQTYMTPPRKPTPNSNVWQQHRLPEDWDKGIEPPGDGQKDKQ